MVQKLSALCVHVLQLAATSLVGHDAVLLLYYYCGADVTLIVHICREFREFCAKNMGASLVISTKEQQSSVIRFHADGVEGVEMHRRMSVQYRTSVVSQRIYCEMIERFKNAPTSVSHEEGAGRRSLTLLMQTRNESVT